MLLLTPDVGGSTMNLKNPLTAIRAGLANLADGPRVAGLDAQAQRLGRLLSNAVRYSNAQGHIEVRGHELDGWVVLEVSDTGIGIAPEEVHQVWEELARGTNGRHVPGSGLGLPYVAAIAKRHHGHATLESKPGEGTRVRLHLPAAH